jgi:hypothetical protein
MSSGSHRWPLCGRKRVYAAAGRLISPLTFLARSLQVVAAPWLARADTDPDALHAEERRMIKVGAALAVALLLAALARPSLMVSGYVVSQVIIFVLLCLVARRARRSPLVCERTSGL